MKKYLGTLMVLGVVFSFGAGIALAETGRQVMPNLKTLDGASKTEPGDKAEAMRAAARAKIEAMRAKAEEIRQKSIDKLQTLREKVKTEKDSEKKGSWLDTREKAFHVFDVEIAKVEQLSTRVKAQITKLKAMGVNMSEAETHVTNAESKLALGKSKFAEITTLLTNSTSQLSDADKAKLKTLARETQTALLDAYKELNMAIKSMRSAYLDYRNAQNGQASGTEN